MNKYIVNINKTFDQTNEKIPNKNSEFVSNEFLSLQNTHYNSYILEIQSLKEDLSKAIHVISDFKTVVENLKITLHEEQIEHAKSKKRIRFLESTQYYALNLLSVLQTVPKEELSQIQQKYGIDKEGLNSFIEEYKLPYLAKDEETNKRGRKSRKYTWNASQTIPKSLNKESRKKDIKLSLEYGKKITAKMISEKYNLSIAQAHNIMNDMVKGSNQYIIKKMKTYVRHRWGGKQLQETNHLMKKEPELDYKDQKYKELLKNQLSQENLLQGKENMSLKIPQEVME